MSHVPPGRVQNVNGEAINPKGAYVLYWMTTTRRPHWNFSLDHAINFCQELSLPLLVLETLRVDYPWASDRLHRFMLQDMADNAAAFAKHDVAFYPFVEQNPGEQEGLIEALGRRAAVVIADDYPSFFLPRMIKPVAAAVTVRFDWVDSIGLLPVRSTTKTYPTAYAFRRHLQKELPQHLMVRPHARPLTCAGLTGARIPADVKKRWPRATEETLAAAPAVLARMPIDHSVGPATFDGGWVAANACAKSFLTSRLRRYAESRNHPDEDGQSGLSPYLHFGHISVHQIFAALEKQEQWDPSHLNPKPRGSKEGYWGMSANAEAFLDEIITWREVGQNMCVTQPDTYDKYSSLPDWAQRTLAEHVHDERPHVYTLKQLEEAQTYDPVWNAAQRQLVQEGRLHNYLRMLWGKKVLEWSKTPQAALKILIELNNKYGVDGRDPNSYSGIFWIFGRYDRPWPEREIFGKIRYMSSDNTLKKLRMKQYMKTFGQWEKPDRL